MKSKAYIQLGTNLGDRVTQLKNAILLIEDCIGPIQQLSSIYETEAWGFNNQPNFLNQVIHVETKLSPVQLMNQLLLIEQKMGRERTFKNAPRIIDLDILFYDDLILSTEQLTIPHPQIQYRKFVLEPLMELNPSFIHPVLNKSIEAMAQDCTDVLNVQKF